MKLRNLYEYWDTIPNYPNSLVKRKNKKRISILKNPEDRERFIKWSIKESEELEELEDEADISGMPDRRDARYEKMLLNHAQMYENAWQCYKYAVLVIRGRWPEAEPLILKDIPYTVYRYAKDVIKDRWPEGEEVIKNDPRMAYEYATDVVGWKWPEGEEAIRKDPSTWAKYRWFLRE